MENATLETFLQAMEQKLAGDIHSVYRLPPSGAGYFVAGRHADTILLVIEHYEQLHEMRQLALEVDATQPTSSHQLGPLIATRASIQRHLALNPLFAQFLGRSGRHIAGDALLDMSPKAPHPAEHVAYLNTQAISGSAALAPQRLPAEVASMASASLCRLAAFFDERAVENQLAAADLFFLVQIHLQRLTDQVGQNMEGQRDWSGLTKTFKPHALFEDRASLLVIIPPGSGNAIRSFDWLSLVQQMPEHLSRLAVTTAKQLRLSAQVERPLDYVLGTYRHIWGMKPLEGLKVTAWAVFRQAARRSSELLVNNLPGDYLIARAEEDVHRIIHDYQNRLLNMRLEQELLNRMYSSQFEDVELHAPDPLPKRDEPLNVRIDAIAEQLDWWTAQYGRHMESQAASQKLSPL